MGCGLSIEQLTLGYGEVTAVQHLDCRIAPGSLTAVVGPNGAGKSSLLKAVAGVLKPLAGDVRLAASRQDQIAYLPQQSELDRSFPVSVIDVIGMGLWKEIGPFGRLTCEQKSRIGDVISTVGLDGLETRPVSSLSGGQMQRVLFARLLLQDAPLILLDEPFTAIDMRTLADLLAIIQRWNCEGRTVLVVLHDLDIVRANFPETLMLARELVAHGRTELVLTAENRFRARQMCEACAGPPHTCGRSAA
ncbi:MAG: zinc ABC transporter ATP-binding protein AztA [Pseudomonadota bacterium]